MIRLCWILLCFASLGLSETPPYIVFLVNARHLDYSKVSQFLQTVAKHPSDGSKNGDVGHAWIYLRGHDEIIEGGHSGETGQWQPCYLDGVFHNVELGAANPVSYLWGTQCDGFFQQGNGGHRPTFAAKVILTEEQYRSVRQFIKTYPFSEYAITGRQCASFVKEIAALIDIDLEDSITLEIDQFIWCCGHAIQMWSDPGFSSITFGSPDRLEKSLKKLVQSGKAENVLEWYLKAHPRSFNWESVRRFPERLARYWLMRGCQERIPSHAGRYPHRLSNR